MKARRATTLLVCAAAVVVAVPVRADFVQLRGFEIPNPFGLRVFDIYAEFDSTTDRLLAVTGTPTCALEVSVIGGAFYQHPLGSDLPPGSVLISVFPELEFDTFVTIGKASEDTATTLSPGWPGFGPSTLAGANVAWAITATDPQGLAGSDLLVQLGRFSTADGSGLEGKIEIIVLVDGNTQQYCLPLSEPTNDFCSNAIPITDGTHTGNTLGATDDSASTCGGSDSSPDVWFEYVAPAAGLLRIDTCGSLFDTAVTRHATCGDAGACNDDCAGTPCSAPDSCMSALVSAGSTSLIRVAGHNGASGDFTLNVGLQAAPPNDACSAATLVSEGVYAFDASAAFASGAPPPPTCFAVPGGGLGADIWYRYAPSCSEDVTVSLCGSSFDTGLVVYDATCPTSGSTIIACNDDFCGQASQVTFFAAAGAQYLLRVGLRSGSAGAGTLTITGETTPINDDCRDAVPVTDGLHLFSTCGTTAVGPSESAPCEGPVAEPILHDVWFRYAPPRTGEVVASLCVSSFDTFLAVYEANCPSSPGLAIVCNDDFCGPQSQVTFVAAAGQQYLIRVGSRILNDTDTAATLSISSAPACVGDLNGDGQIDLIDLATLLSQFGTFCP